MGRRSSKCSIERCETTNGDKEKVCMFNAPKDEAALKRWNEAIGSDKPLNWKDVVCERHFNSEDIIRERKSKSVTHTYAKPKLKSGAVPAIFPDDSSKPSKKLDDPPALEKSSHSIFDNMYEKALIPTLPPFWTYCPYSNDDGKYIVFTENSVHDHKPIVTRQILMNEHSKLNYFHNFNALNANVLNLKETLTTLNDLDGILDSFKLLKCCPGGPEKDQFEVNYNHISFVDAKTQKWRHKKCSYMIFANDIICSFCKYLCDINVFKYSEKKTRRKERQDGVGKRRRLLK